MVFTSAVTPAPDEGSNPAMVSTTGGNEAIKANVTEIPCRREHPRAGGDGEGGGRLSPARLTGRHNGDHPWTIQVGVAACTSEDARAYTLRKVTSTQT